jgi:predicted house-cleaning noncanonical NTP pyrophosphatase (MazG superfamily)
MLAVCEYHSGMSKELPPSRTAEQFVVRFPDGMRDRIAEAAKESGRSMNAEIVLRLQRSFDTTTATTAELDDLRTKIQDVVDEVRKIKRLEAELQELKNPGPNTVIGD